MSQQPTHDELAALFRDELALCKMKAGETIAVLTEGDMNRAYAEAFVAAIGEAGATPVPVHLEAPAGASANDKLGAIGQNQLGRDREAMATLKSADMVIDLMLLLFSWEQIEIQKAGTRVLLVVEPYEVLNQLMPTEELRRRVEACAARLAKAGELRFTNPAGTDVTYDIGGRPLLEEYGYTDKPGRWDHFPGGLIATLAQPGGVQGRVVMDRSDIVYPFKTFLEAPVEFTIRDSMITDIKGEDDAERLREHMARFDDPRAFAVSHIGWGLNQNADWSVAEPGIGMNGRVFHGSVLFSTGPDTEFGGDNDTACHMDLPLGNCDLFLDGEPIIEAGVILPEDMRAPGH